MRRFALFATGAAVAAVTTGIASPARAQVPQRDVETFEEYVPNRGLIVSGSIVLGVTYGVSTIVAMRDADAADRALYVPLAGPWIDLAERDGCKGALRCDGETTNKVLLVADGVGQAIGALQIVGGFLFPAKRTVTTVGSVQLVPNVGPKSTGLTAYGTF
jgi:hypothetical protein